MKVLVVGPGGSGQSFFISLLNENNNIITNDVVDKDGDKHIRYNLKVVKKYDKVIYVYNNPFKSLCSHFRRGWVKAQFNKMKGGKVGFPTEDIHEYLKDVSKNKIDYFEYYNHIKSWYDKKEILDIHFLNFEDPDFNKLKEFLGEDIYYDLKERSNYLDIIENNREGYNFYQSIYKNIKDLLNG